MRRYFNNNMLITLTGDIPSKKNQRQTFYKNGRVFNIASENHTKWHKDASKQLASCPQRLKNALCGVKMQITVYRSTKRSFDLDNTLSAILDLLKDNRIVHDDSMTCIPDIHVQFGGVDKIGGARIIVEEL